MGWFSISKEGEWKREETDGRPVQEGEEGKLQVIGQEDFGHKVAIDLVSGVILLDYDTLNWQNGTVEITGLRSVLYICDETNILGEMVDVKRARGRATKDGWFKQNISRIEFRPIWFTRYTNNIPAKIIGAQATLPKNFGGKNVKKYIILFADGRVGVY